MMTYHLGESVGLAKRIIDLRKMQKVTIDKAAMTATAQGGLFGGTG
jgi:hypothetical protein